MTDFDTADQDGSDRLLRDMLERGETLLWSGHPRRDLRLQASDLFLIPFSLMFCGFALFWETTVATHKAPLMFRLWGLPFVVLGLYFVFGRFFVDAYQRSRTSYGVTGRRILIAKSGLRRNVQTIGLEGTPEISLSLGREGRGTLTFGRDLPSYNGSLFYVRGFPGSNIGRAPCFDGIDDPKAVLDLIRKAQRAVAAAP